jgi:hypothetical protein
MTVQLALEAITIPDVTTSLVCQLARVFFLSSVVKVENVKPLIFSYAGAGDA